MKIGKYEVSTLEVSSFGLDGGAMFGIIPKPLWSKKISPDERNRIQLTVRALLLQNGEQNILVDTGMGDKWDQKYAEIYAIDFERANLEKALRSKSLEPDDITDVVLTHLHFDHAGGALKFEDEELIPTFPNATYYVQKNHWYWANDPSVKDAGSFREQDFLPLMEHDVLTLIDGEDEIFPGVELILSEGHTVSQQLLLLENGSQSLFYCGDLIPTTAHLPIAWVMAYDIYPVITAKEKQKYLTRAVEENWILVLDHDSSSDAVSVEIGDKGFQVRETYSL